MHNHNGLLNKYLLNIYLIICEMDRRLEFTTFVCKMAQEKAQSALDGFIMPPTPPNLEEVEGAYWFGSVRAVSECVQSVSL